MNGVGFRLVSQVFLIFSVGLFSCFLCWVDFPPCATMFRHYHRTKLFIEVSLQKHCVNLFLTWIDLERLIWQLSFAGFKKALCRYQLPCHKLRFVPHLPRGGWPQLGAVRLSFDKFPFGTYGGHAFYLGEGH